MATPIKKIKQYKTPKQLHDEQIVPWSAKTIIRRIQFDGLPAIKDVNGYLIDLDDLDKWLLRRKVG